jgi:kynurenine formamidase
VTIADDYQRWILARGDERPFGRHDRRGTANLIDPAARLRGRQAIETGQFVFLAQPLTAGSLDAPPAPLTMDVRYEYHGRTLALGVAYGYAIDHLEVDCHGFGHTHMDALNHVSLDGRFYGGARWGDPGVPDVGDLASQCYFTRAVLADIPAVRGTTWVDDDHPVTGRDIELALGDDTLVPGDALLLYMGRDRFEAAGNTFGTHGPDGTPLERRPGVGHDGARWIADHGVSVLCWDLMDAIAEDEASSAVHQLLYAFGQVLIDNCVLGLAAETFGAAGRRTAALSVQPVAYPGGTGSLVQPVLIL